MDYAKPLMEVSESKPSAPLKSTLLADVLLAPPQRDDVNTELSTDMDDIPAHVKRNGPRLFTLCQKLLSVWDLLWTGK